jgi:hypothetical protein
MDESELEVRLRRRLHERFDGQRASSPLRDAVRASLTTRPMASRRLTPGSLFAASRQLLAVAAVIVLVVVAAVAVIGQKGPVGQPLPSASASASPSTSKSPLRSAPASASASPTAPAISVPPISTAAWSGLDLVRLAGAPEMSWVVPWAGGYVAIGQTDANANFGVWTSSDGRTWAALPQATFGLDDPARNTVLIGGAACGSGVLIVGEDGSGNGSLWFSADAQTWRPEAMPGGAIAQVRQAFIAGSAAGAELDNESGPAIDVTTDCSSWRRVVLSGPASVQVTAVAAVGTGFVALDASSPAPDSQPRAWWSADGASWSAAAVQAAPGADFTSVWTAGGGLIAQSQGGGAQGSSAIWSSVDGHAWAIRPSADPLGVTTHRGQGVPAGTILGDGTRFLAWGMQDDNTFGPTEYLASADGRQWTRLAITGDLPTGPSGAYRVFLMRDGVLVSGNAGTWFGAASTK